MIKVGFILNFKDQSWIGGINYYKNLFSALSATEDRKIEPLIFSGFQSDMEILKLFTGCQIVKSSVFDENSPKCKIRRIFEKILKKDIILERLLIKHKISLLSHYGLLGQNSCIPTIGWIPDFQHKYLPEFFSKEEAAGRDKYFKKICRDSTSLILSSNSAKKDAERFFPDYKNKFNVLHFFSGDFNFHNLPEFDLLKKKYSIFTEYFIVPNQFWIHKNHAVIIDALKITKDLGYEIRVIATGNTSDYRQPAYFNMLEKKISKYGIQDNFICIGLVHYDELIQLMINSLAIINPSLFEGWSTSVEEAKSLNLSVILSDIPVHREQNPKYGIFFDPYNSQQLAEILIDFLNSYPKNNKIFDYQQIEMGLFKKKVDFAKSYENIVFETMTMFSHYKI